MADNNLNIGSFSDDEGYQVEDFQDSDSVGMAPPPATNIPSNRNQAATVALLNSNDPVQQMATYQAVNAELVNRGNSPTMQDITEAVTSNEQAAMQRTTAQYLANPAISDEWKANAIQAVNIALELTGNHGLSRQNPLERHYRNVLCGRVHTPQSDSAWLAAGNFVFQSQG